MAGGNFMHRVVSYLVNELLVNSLANRLLSLATGIFCSQVARSLEAKESHTFGPAFQRFAVRTSKRIDDISTIAVKKRQELAEQMKDLSKNFESNKYQ
ncbi:hypothetical protein TIFTF001_009585 [Ficus carica]|uniref:Uncharacterized protein n=1 Tax=Ficus carica TaxID=3494 RepID=A0AA88CZ35_FICCA|nr:hypothetical protein TIFTF001_009585 [Ficus carica]